MLVYACFRLPPVPPLANSREEAAQQEQAIHSFLSCLSPVADHVWRHGGSAMFWCRTSRQQCVVKVVASQRTTSCRHADVSYVRDVATKAYYLPTSKGRRRGIKHRRRGDIAPAVLRHPLSAKHQRTILEISLTFVYAPLKLCKVKPAGMLDSPAWHTTGAILHATNTVAETWSRLRGPCEIYLLTSPVRFKMLVLEVAVVGVAFAPFAFPHMSLGPGQAVAEPVNL